MSTRCYDTDLNDAAWAWIAPYLPAAPSGGRPRTTDLRVIAAFGGLKSHPPPEMQRIAQDALTRIGSAQPVTQTPAVSAASNRSEPPPAPRVDLAGEWSAWFPAGAIPVWINGNIYQPGFVGPNAYFLQVSPTCTVSRAALIGRDPVVRRALPAAPRAELVSLAVRRATLVKP